MLIILIPLSAVAYVHAPIRYALVAVPVIALVSLEMTRRSSSRTAIAVVLILAGSLHSSIILWSDVDFAEWNRSAAQKLIAPHVAGGERVWFGGQWGFYWYAQRAGGEISKPGGEAPKQGDLLAVDLMRGGSATLARFPNRSLVERLSYLSKRGSTLGLYSNLYSKLLWNMRHEVGIYELWRID